MKIPKTGQLRLIFHLAEVLEHGMPIIMKNERYLPYRSIGKKLALLELKFMLATLYRNYVLRLVPDHKYDVEITVTMHEMYVP